MKKKTGSPVYQVTKTFQSIFTPGENRHADKQIKLEDGSRLADRRIYSIGTMRSYVSVGVDLALHCRKKYDVRDIRKITSPMAQAYLDERARKGCAGGTLSREKAAIRKLSRALHGKAWEIGGTWHSDRRPDRFYSRRDALRIEGHLHRRSRDPQCSLVVRVMRVTGARRSEAAQLRGKDIDPEKGTVRIERGTKGGKTRIMVVAPPHRAFLAKLKARADKHKDGYVFQSRAGLPRRVENAVAYACRKLEIKQAGTHGLRKLFARERYRQYRREGHSDKEARRLLARDLGHNRVRVTYSYVPRNIKL